MDTQKIITEITQEVKDIMGSEGTGHDWWHIYRVLAMSATLGSVVGFLSKKIVL